ncbi:hypothetical protein HYFRA_00009058 [Hymenoscyphus fraxineus]|uniref:Uncharacterized protein n=1 Tax=Hymenoscyphus fraxineus TaxID=746836 RepID=A0A9N9PI49_9HELO|nr:hypothetical protein HYFRA_00009058 [Hymenoscyphus fraxineus]
MTLWDNELPGPDYYLRIKVKSRQDLLLPSQLKISESDLRKQALNLTLKSRVLSPSTTSEMIRNIFFGLPQSHSPRSSSSSVITLAYIIFLKTTEPKPTEADLHDEKNWCSADYTHREDHKRSVISEKFVRSKLRDHWKEGISKVELIWHTKDSSRYWIGQFHVKKMQKHSAPIKFGFTPNKTPYTPPVVVPPQNEAVDINDEQEEQTTNEPHLFQPSPACPYIIMALVIAGTSFSRNYFLGFAISCLSIRHGDAQNMNSKNKLLSDRTSISFNGSILP